MKLLMRFLTLLSLLYVVNKSSATCVGENIIAGCDVFPITSVWNACKTTVSTNSMSSTWLGNIILSSDGFLVNYDCKTTGGHFINHTGGSTVSMWIDDHTDTGYWNRAATVNFGTYPFDSILTKIQGGDPDSHCVMVDTTNCLLYETYGQHKSTDKTFKGAARYGVKWNLSLDTLRCDATFDLTDSSGTTIGELSSADEAGLPIAPGVIRYEEASNSSGTGIQHMLRMQARAINIDGTNGSHMWPATHESKGDSVSGGVHYQRFPHNSNYIPLGAILLLDSSFPVPANMPIWIKNIIYAMETFGAVLADRGSNKVALSIENNPNWPSNFADTLQARTVGISAYLRVLDTSTHKDHAKSMKWKP